MPNIPDQSKAKDKHQRIISAAVKVFARKGFFQAKVSEIARAAGVADGTIYLYFRNKDDILITLFKQAMQGVLVEMKAALDAEQNPADKLAAFARTHLDLVKRNPELAGIIQVEIRQSAKYMKEYDKTPFREYLDLLSGVIKQGQVEGLFNPEVLPGVFKRAFFGALDEMSRYWIMPSARDYSPEEAARQISRFFLCGIENPGSS